MKRGPTIRALGPQDMRYIWLLYRTNQLQFLEEFRPVMAAVPTPAEFLEVIATLLRELYDYAWVLESSSGDKRAVGICFGLNCHRFVVLGELTWLPWATKRQKLETVVKLVQEMGKWKPAQFYFAEKFKELGVYLCRLGLARRIGTSVELNEDRLFETKTSVRDGKSG